MPSRRQTTSGNRPCSGSSRVVRGLFPRTARSLTAWGLMSAAQDADLPNEPTAPTGLQAGMKVVGFLTPAGWVRYPGGGRQRGRRITGALSLQTNRTRTSEST